jgi:hypothetical protein
MDTSRRRAVPFRTRMGHAVMTGMKTVPFFLVMMLTPALAVTSRQPGSGAPCRVAGKGSLVRPLREGSGIAASRSRPGVLWAHNDSSAPTLVALDENGAVTGQVHVSGARVVDWEDIAVAPCPRGSCVYIGDIGDNNGTRGTITVYRVAEPAAGAQATDQAEIFRAKYPDGPIDAESLFVTAAGEIYIVTKGDPGPVALYRFPRPPGAGTTVQLERVGAPAGSGRISAKDRPTAAAISPDGRWVAVRTSEYVSFFPATDFTSGRWKETYRADVRALGEPQGEGVAFGHGGSIFLLGEGTSRGGTFARLECELK